MQWLKRVLASCGFRSKQLGLSNLGHYRSGLIMLSIIHGLYTIVFQVCLKKSNAYQNLVC